jgi:hypothetical protein
MVKGKKEQGKRKNKQMVMQHGVGPKNLLLHAA